MTQVSIGTIVGGALVGGVLLLAGGQTAATQLALLGEPAASVALQATTFAQSAAAQSILDAALTAPPGGSAADAAGIGVQLTQPAQRVPSVADVAGSPAPDQPGIICYSCTPAPAATATPGAARASVTPAGPALTPQPSQPTATRTPRTTRTAAPTPNRGAMTATATAQRPTTSATPTRRPATPTRTPAPTQIVSPGSPTAALPIATATSTTQPTPGGVVLPGNASPTPIPIPPAPQASFQLWVSSDFDPSGAIYRSTGATVSWPAGEVLNFAPAVTLVAPPTPDPGVIYRSRVVAWSFVSSGGQRAPSMDVMGHSGCRLRAEPAPRDAAGLAGCAYRYLERPTADAMRMQAHAFWSAGTPLDMCVDVHTYDLGRLRDTDLALQAAIRTEALDAVTGQVLASATTVRSASFAIRLTVPRSAH